MAFKPAAIDHVNIFVRNAERSHRWYTEVFGFHTQDMSYFPESGKLRAAFLSCDANHAHDIALFDVGDNAQPQQKGQVISTDPAAGFGLKKGASVSVVVGAGPAQITLDDYKGQQYQDAATQLRSKGLRPARNDVNNAAPAGQVISSNPPANSRVTAGALITLNVSTGKTALPRLAALLSESDAMLGNDTGPLHLAAAEVHRQGGL